MRLHVPAVLVALGLLMSGSSVRAQFGTVKGQVIYGAEKLPAPQMIEPTQDKEHCLSKGPLFSDLWVINKTNKGVKWVYVWLVDAKGKSLPANPNLKLPPKVVKVDQPCCMFIPRHVVLHVSQTLEVENSSPTQHNVNWAGGGAGQNNGNVTVAPGKSQSIFPFKPTTLAPVLIACNIHGWMKGNVRIFDHLYYALTDTDGKFEIQGVPVGTWNLVVWHEGSGWGTGDSKGSKKPITVKAGEGSEVGQIKIVSDE